MIRSAFFLLFFLTLGACKKRAAEPDVLSKQKMVEVLTDMQLAEAAARLRLMPEDYKREPEKWYLELMEAHGTDTSEFSLSLKYYSARPAVLFEIYEEVNANLMKEAGMEPPPEKKPGS